MEKCASQQKVSSGKAINLPCRDKRLQRLGEYPAESSSANRKVRLAWAVVFRSSIDGLYFRSPDCLFKIAHRRYGSRDVRDGTTPLLQHGVTHPLWVSLSRSRKLMIL